MHQQNKRLVALIFIIFGLAITLISGQLASAQCVPGPTGGPGDDTITCSGNTFLIIDGDLEFQLGDAVGVGNDTIVIYGVQLDVSGEWVESIDGTALAMGSDTITIYGIVDDVFGDAAISDTGTAIARGSDIIINNGDALAILGSLADSLTGDATASGNNTLINNGILDELIGNFAITDTGTALADGSSIIVNTGDAFVLAGSVARTDSGIAIASGDDTIISFGSALIITGDRADTSFVPGATAIASGNDTIIVFGPSMEIIGDLAEGDTATASGDDTIINYGETGYIIGDAALSATGDATASGDDTIVNHGIVHFDIISDVADNMSLPPGSDPTGNGITTGNDAVVNHGVVEGGIFTGGGNDQVIIVNGAPVLGIMDGGAGTDSLTFELASADYTAQYTTLAAWANALVAQNPAGGTITIDGKTFTWQNFEDLMTYFRLLAACNLWPAQVFYPDAQTIDVWGPDGNEGFHVATIDRQTLTRNPAGQRFDHPSSARGWYVMVYWVNDHYQINVYDQHDTLLTDRCLFPDMPG